MNFIADCFGVLVIVYFVSIPFIWAWVFYHKIKCRKKEECSNRKCKYWQFCEHNYVERKKDELDLRKQMLMHSLGLTEEKLDENITIEIHYDLLASAGMQRVKNRRKYVTNILK